METSVHPGSANFGLLYAPLVGAASRDSVLPEIAKATSFLARRLAQRTIPYDDLMQEGLLACVLAIYSFDAASGASFPTYALHCAHNRMIDCVRREKRTAANVDSGDAILDDESNETLFDRLPRHPTSSEDLDYRVLVGQLNAAIHRLPARERLCIVLFFREELLQEDVAALLGISRARVGQLLAQALERLRRSIAQ